ncbi:uncharacterized protein LOC101241823 isoform X1 [Hydra vulgaris]|uniref:uncharacterized protein LOC101241823 isoform X1 n=1 Tax=Hydra vulgaris TaxID=6087 RepID=UPI001F5F9E2C|nr:uncharacterized protein LOC101241823 isoform X1 [Hydra vulgaris]
MIKILLIFSTWLCYSECSVPGIAAIPKSIKGNSVLSLTYTDQKTLVNKKLECSISEKGEVNIIQNDLSYNSKKSFLIPLNSTLIIHLKSEKDFDDKNCYGMWTISNSDNKKQCWSDLCNLNTFLSLNNPCNRKSKWMMNYIGDYKIEIHLMQSDAKLKIDISITVVNHIYSPNLNMVMRDSFYGFNVELRPYSSCELWVYDVNSTIEFYIYANNQIVDASFTINKQSIIAINTSIVPFNYSFSKEGFYELEITVTTAFNTFIWPKTVSIVQVIYNISINGILGAKYVVSGIPITFTLVVLDKCLAMPKSLTWILNNKYYMVRNVDSLKSIILEKVGIKSKLLVLTISELPSFSYEINVLDVITNFTVKTDKDLACVNDNITFIFNVDSGSDVIYTYRKLPDFEINKVIMNFSMLFDHISTISYEFNATNIVSSFSLTKTLTILSSIVTVQFPDFRSISTGKFYIQIKSLSSCYLNVYYKWVIQIASNVLIETSWSMFDAKVGAGLNFTFNDEGYYTIIFTVMYGNNNFSISNTTSFINVLNRISFNMPKVINANVDNKILVSPIDWQGSKVFQFRWWLNGEKGDWGMENKGRAPINEMTFRFEGRNNITLEVKNDVSNISISSTVIVQYSAENTSVQLPQFVVVNDNFNIKLKFKYISMFLYFINIKISEADDTFNITNLQTYNYVGKCFFEGFFLINISISDNVNTFNKQESLNVLRKIQVLNITGNQSSLIIESILNLEVFVNVVAQSYEWYYDGSIFNYTKKATILFLSLGSHEIKVVVRNQVTNDSAVFNVVVYPNISFLEIITPNIMATELLYFANSSIICPLLSYSWTINFTQIGNLSTQNLKFTESGFYTIELNVSSPLQTQYSVKVIEVIKLCEDPPLITYLKLPLFQNQTLFVAYNSSIDLVIKNVNRIAYYLWKVIPQDEVQINKINDRARINFNVNSVDKLYDIVLETKIYSGYTLYKAVKYTYPISVLKPIKNITIDLDKIIVFNKTYIFYIFWQGSQSFIKNNLTIEGEAELNVLNYSENSIKGSLLSLKENQIINMTLEVCNKLNCINSSGSAFQFTSIDYIDEVEPFPSQRYLSSHSNVTFEVFTKAPNSTYEWHIKNCSNFSWYIGNSSKVVIESLEDFAPGNYTVEVIVSGPYIRHGIIKKTFVITIFFEDCKSPNVQEFSKARLQLRSLWFYSEVNATADCNITFQWEFEVANFNTDCSQRVQRVKFTPSGISGSVINTNSATLQVPPRGFLIGYYCVISKIKFGNNGILEVAFFLEVVASTLLPKISGGSFQVIGNLQSFALSVSNTIDPDISYPNKPALLYKWSNIICEDESKTYNITDWNKFNSVIHIKPYCLTPFQYYTFTVAVKREYNNNEQPVFASQQIYVINGTVPLASVECITCNTYKSHSYFKYKKLKLFATCTNCGTIVPIYKWEVVGVNDNKSINLDSHSVLTPLNAPVFILNSGVLDGLQSYKIIINISLEGMDAVGFSSFFIESNSGPQDGSCTITPGSGIAFVTKFIVHCLNWQDKDNANQPFLYEVIAEIGTVATTMYRGINYNFAMAFPSGDIHENWRMGIVIQVEDSLGSITKGFVGSIQVVPQNTSDCIKFFNEWLIPYFESTVHYKDINKMSSSIIASMLLLNKTMTNSAQVSGILNKLIHGATSLAVDSMNALYQVSNALDLVIMAGDKFGLDRSTRSIVTLSISSFLNLADLFSNEGFSLDETSYLPIFRVISSNTKIDFDDNDKRKRRSVENLNLNLLNHLYEIILSTTLPGELGKGLESNYIFTSLRRNTGSLLNGDVQVGMCSVFSNISQISNYSDLSQILECSPFNPFKFEKGSKSVLTFSYKNASFTELPISNLSEKEQILLNIPAELDTSVSNSSFIIKPSSVYISKLPLFENISYFNESAVNVLFDIVEYSGKGKVYVYLSENVNLTESNKPIVLTFGSEDDIKARSIFLPGSNYSLSSVYYLGIEHDFSNNISLNVYVYTSHCLYWNTMQYIWDSTGCIPTQDSTPSNIVCKCNHLTSFTGSFQLQPNPLNFSLLKKLDIQTNPVAFVTCLCVVLLYMIGLFIAYRCDKREQKGEHIIPFIGGDDGFYQYEIRFKTGPYPFAGSTAKIGIQIFGTSCTTKVRVINSNNHFLRNGLDIFRISLHKSVGKIHKIHLWHDNSGLSPSWYIERVVIRSLFNGEKFFFFCNRWLGVDFEDGTLEADFYVANMIEMQKFSTIFFDVLLRMFNDFHLWLSIFERPKFSRFSRVQRLTCLVTLILSWMAVNAMWFQVAPDGKIDLYIGFQGYSLEEVAISFITVAMVFPINLLFVLLFKKSRQRNVPKKKLKVWHQQNRTTMDIVELDAKPFLSGDKEIFDVDVVDSLVRRKKKFKNVHTILERENRFNNLDIMLKEESQQNNNAAISNESSGSDIENVLLLPHSFNASKKKVYRGSFGKLNAFYKNLKDSQNEKAYELTRTQSLYTIKKNLNTNDLEESLMKLRFSETQLNNRSEGIIRKQISSMFDQLIEENHEDVKSDHSSGIFYPDNDTSTLIKKNEILAEKLSIPEIHEYDSCTRWTLPHLFVYVGYLCCFSISLFSILVTIVYGQYFGYDLALKWLKMLIFGIIGDFFLVFPFVLILLTVVVAIIKPLDLDQIDHYDFVECNDLSEKNVGTNTVSPLTGYSLEIAQRFGLKDKKIRQLAKLFLSQAILMWTVMSVCWLILPDSSSYATSKFFQNTWNSPTSIETVNSMHSYWSWFENSWIPFLYMQPNKTWLIASHPLVIINGCFIGGCFNPIYAVLGNTTKCHMVSNLTTFINKENVTSFAQVSHQWKMDLTNSSSITKFISLLKSLKWYDTLETSVKLEVIFANSRSSDCVYVSLKYFMSPGYDKVGFDIIYYRSNFFDKTSDYFIIFCLVLLFIVMLIIFSKKAKKSYHIGWKVLKGFWKLHSALMIFFINMAITVVVMHIVYVLYHRNKRDSGIVSCSLNSYTSAILNNTVIYVIGFLGFLVIIRNIRLFQLFSSYLYCSQSLSSAAKELVYFSLIHALVSLIFTGVAMLLFDCSQFATFPKAYFYVLFMRWWKPGYKVITDSSYGLGNAWFFLWSFYWLAYALHMFKSILNNSSYCANRKKSENLDLLNHMWKKFNKSVKTNRRVGFIEMKDLNEGNAIEVQTIEAAQKPLPPLPYNTFDLDSKFSFLLTGLDKMINNDALDEEMIKNYEKKIKQRKKLYRLSYTLI